MTLAATASVPFDDMPSDLDFGHTAEGEQVPLSKVHPFEGKGLGKAPYSCAGHRLGGGTTCDYCGTGIKHEFNIKSSDGRSFTVGSECVLKAGSIEVAGFDRELKKLRSEQSAASRQRAKARETERVEEARQEWTAVNTELYAWLYAKRQEFDFARSLLDHLGRKGALTEGQQAAAERCMLRDREREAAKAVAASAKLEAAPVVSTLAIEECFALATSKGTKNPVLRLGEFRVKPAKATSANPGALYVMSRDGETYLGKVLSGKFLRTRDCSPEREAAVVEVCKDPKTAAIAYGKQFGVCAVCGRDLSDEESVGRGIGPVCAEKYGF